MLTLSEEIVLLALDEKSGELRSTKEFGVECALVGAASLDLALAKRIKIEGDTVQVADGQGFQPMSEWIEELFSSRKDLQQETLQSLTSRGVLREKKSRFPWLPDSERFEIVDSAVYEQTKARIARAILTDEMPEARDSMLVTLARTCGLLEPAYSGVELSSRKRRLQTLREWDALGRAVADAIESLDDSVISAMRRD